MVREPEIVRLVGVDLVPLIRIGEGENVFLNYVVERNGSLLPVYATPSIEHNWNIKGLVYEHRRDLLRSLLSSKFFHSALDNKIEIDLESQVIMQNRKRVYIADLMDPERYRITFKFFKRKD